MPSPVQIYQKEMHGNLGFFANWLPSDPLDVGMIGTLEDGRFRQVAHLSDFGIRPDVSKPGSGQPLKYRSTSGIDVAVDGGVGSDKGMISTNVTIEFSAEGAFIFEALNVRQIQITDRFDVAAKIIECYENGKWDADWFVIESLYLADSASILISQDQSARLVLAAESKFPILSTSLADPKLNLSIKSTRGRVFEAIAIEDLRPLYSCLRVRDRLFSSPKVSPVRGLSNEMSEVDLFERPSIDTLINS